jgi:hypothetical protein
LFHDLVVELFGVFVNGVKSSARYIPVQVVKLDEPNGKIAQIQIGVSRHNQYLLISWCDLEKLSKSHFR